MTHPALKELRFSELRHIDARREPPTLAEGLKTISLVTASIAVAFGIFYELLMLCLALGFSAWWAAVVFVGLYARWFRKQLREAVHVA